MGGAILEIAGALEASAAARMLKFSRWAYAGVNAGHVLGIALLVGAILPMDLRLMGLWRGIGHGALARVLVPVAAAGLLLAVATGALLFIVRAEHYAGLVLVQAKLALVAAAAGLALLLHLRAGLWLERMAPWQGALHGAASLACWLAALVCGRMIAYVAP
ncbi:MAG: hypothetical protein AAF074_23340 [Pseudomonadota bacterium]